MSNKIIRDLKSMGYRLHSQKENLYAKPFGYSLLIYSIEKRVFYNIFAVNGKIMKYSTEDFEELSNSFTGIYEDDFLYMLKYTETYLGFIRSESTYSSSFEFLDNTENISLMIESDHQNHN